MADVAQTPEAVAFALMEIILRSENKHVGTDRAPDRGDILQTYADCLKITKGQAAIRRGTVKMSA